ncbi:MAG: biopolymer transporter ExbD [Pirellulales bacterium]
MPLKIQHDETPALNLTSMIDILFLLIIFFMVATKFDEMERNIQVAVPQVARAEENDPPPKPLVVCIDSDGGIDLDGMPVTLEELTARLASARSSAGSPPVVIRGDAKCAFQSVASALAACREAGISELGITVRIAGLGAQHIH